MLERLSAALDRISEGAYGTCVECGDAISAARLRATPEVQTCVRCQDGIERVGRHVDRSQHSVFGTSEAGAMAAANQVSIHAPYRPSEEDRDVRGSRHAEIRGHLLSEQGGCDMTHKLPPLRFPYDALEPYIDAETMELHHDKHHQAYVDNLNKAIEPYPQLADLTTEDLLRRLDQVPEEIRTAVRSHGGGHVNHELFWEILAPKAGTGPKGAIADAITKHFGSFARFQSLFTDAATKHFGSGWAFLVVNPSTEGLEIMSLPNQDSVLLHGKPALLCCDVWEHAYYLKYRNRRQDYLVAWWNVVAWDAVDQRLEDVRAGRCHV